MNRHERRGKQKTLPPNITSATNEIFEAMHAAHAMHIAGNIHDAEKIYEQVLKQQPNHADALFLMGMAKHSAGDKISSLRYLHKALTLDKNNHLYHYHKGVVLQDNYDLELAIPCFKKSIELRPDFLEAYLGLGVAYDHLNKSADAIQTYELLLEREPHHSAGCNNLATLRRDANNIDDATDLYKRANAITPDPIIHSNLLLCLNYATSLTSEAIFAAHKEWNTLYAAPFSTNIPPHINLANPDKKIKIAYLSADLKHHPVGDFLLPAMMHHDKQHFEIYCYSAVFKGDEITDLFKKHADHWQEIIHLTDDAVASQVRADGIDILIDLAGHTAGNRLGVFARKPAPVQVSWIGYFNTTGLDNMDYFISDNVHMPVGTEKYFTEEILRLPDAYIAYAPPKDAPEPVIIAPAIARKTITFGSFNHMAKINSEVVAVWAEILHKVAGSRLILKAKTLDNAAIRASYLKAFTDHGIDAARIELLGWSSPKELYRLYHQVDIALDPFPFSGGATSCNALWMGVPVVTLAGESPVSRQTATYLTQIGLTELITTTKEDYIACAVALSQDTEHLNALRATLRPRMASSPLCDGARFAKGLEAAYRQIWQKWCISKHHDQSL